MSNEAKARRQGSKQAELLSRSDDPLDVIGLGASVYAKIGESGQGEAGELFSRSGNGIINKVTGINAILPTGYPTGLTLSWTSGTGVAVAPGRCRSDDDSFDMTIPVPLTAILGALPAGAHYAVWVFADSFGVNAPIAALDASYTAPAVPAGYDKKRRVGTVRVELGGGGEGPMVAGILMFRQRGNGPTRRYIYDENQLLLRALHDGASAAFVAVSLAPWVPPSSDNAVLLAAFATGAGGAAGDSLFIKPASGAATDGPIQLRIGFISIEKASWQVEVPTDPGGGGAPSIAYKVSNAVANLADLFVTSFDDEI